MGRGEDETAGRLRPQDDEDVVIPTSSPGPVLIHAASHTLFRPTIHKRALARPA